MARDGRPQSASARRRRGCARWRAGPTDLDDVLDEPVTQRMVAHLDAMLARHAAGEPLAYVLGRWSFRHLDLIVDHRVLIPRPETEVVAGVAIDLARADPAAGDRRRSRHRLGRHRPRPSPTSCPSTACGVADRRLARRPRHRPGQPRRDRSPPANVRIAGGSWFDALPAGVVPDVVVSNPPYVADGSPDVDAAVRDWEPHGALFAGPDGLDAIRLLVAGARADPTGWLAVLEIGADQGPAVEQLLRGAGYTEVRSARPRRPGPRSRRPAP